MKNYFAAGVLPLVLGAVAFTASVPVLAHSQASAAKPPARVRAKLDGFDIEPKTGKAPNQIGGASRDIGGKLTLYAPKMAKSYTLNPTFYWSADDAAAEYSFRLSILSTGQAEVFQTKVIGSKFMYPTDAPALVPGSTYVWQVTPVNYLLGGPASATILIIGGAERSAVEAGVHGNSVTLAEAKLFTEKRLWYDAVAAYTSLIEAEPNHPEFYKGRAELYDQFPQTQPLADLDMSKAQH